MFVYGYLMTGVPLKSKHFPKFRKKFMTEFLPSKFVILQGVNKSKKVRCFPMIFVNFSEQPFFKTILSEVTAVIDRKRFWYDLSQGLYTSAVCFAVACYGCVCAGGEVYTHTRSTPLQTKHRRTHKKRVGSTQFCFLGGGGILTNTLFSVNRASHTLRFSLSFPPWLINVVIV